MAVQESDPERQNGAGGVRATQDEIIQAIRVGDLHYRENSMHGNPWLRLLRGEVEALVKKKHGANYLKDQQAKTELRGINREPRRLKIRIAELEQRKSKLTASSGDDETIPPR